MLNKTTLRRGAPLAGALALALALSACASSEDQAVTPAAGEEHDDHGHDDHDADASGATQQQAPTPRLALTYDGGIVVLDANSLETVANLELGGFNRLNPAGDGRHVAVSTAGGWAVLDMGTYAQAHGDHSHYFTSEPALSDVLVEATTPGHVVVHDGLASLFDDGTGAVSIVETSEWTESVEHEHAHVLSTYQADEAHHGVAIAVEDGSMLVTLSDRSGAMLLDPEGNVVAQDNTCPGVHGETAFAGADGTEYMMVGCEDGVLLFTGDGVTKLPAPDAFGRIGNQFSVDGNDIVLGDYKTDPEDGIGLNRIALIDATTGAITVVDPFAGADVRYTWRDLHRTPEGDALVLGTDGVLRVIDVATGEVTVSVPVTGVWDVPDEWQSPHPAVEVVAGMAYVTEPATQTVHIVDYVTGEVWQSVNVGVAMNEVVGVEGA